MCTPTTFQELMVGVLRHDSEATTVMVQRYGPAILREVRMMLLTRSHLRRTIDSEDVVQSVLANFFLRLDLGELDLENPEQLVALLREMARNRVRDKVRHRRALRRDGAREQYGTQALEEAACDEPTPSQIVVYEELLGKARDMLTSHERAIAELRRAHAGWEQIARELHESPEALRKQYSRAVDRVVKELGLGTPPKGGRMKEEG
jgi:RNA polymerase sigma factor (sigma-70 family)